MQSTEESKTQRLKTPKNAKTRRVLKAHSPKTVEEVKQALLICGHRFSNVGKEALKDLQKLKYSECVLMSRKHIGLAPFEDGGEMHLEKMSQQYDCGLFVVANHTKSKPDNLVFGRFYDHRIYDMVELGMTAFRSMQSFATERSFVQGVKPCFVFVGEKFETETALKLVKNLFLDFFRGRDVDGVHFDGLQRLVVVTAATTDRVLFRQFKISPRKQSSGNATLEDFVEMGPRFDFVVRRLREAPDELKKDAMKKAPAKKREKNVKLDALENKVGAVYVPTQEVDKIITARHKGFKRQRRETREAENAAKRRTQRSARENANG